MPILSCRCVITQCERGKETARRRTWIEAHEIRALMLAATREIAAAPEACEYALFTPPDIPHAGVFLEVVHDRSSALVGPMSGPQPPEGCSSEMFYPFEELLGRIGEPGRDRYLAIVKRAAIWDRSTTPARGEHESAATYRQRCEAFEHQRVEWARHEGMHVLHYPVPSSRWRARDLEQVLGLAYRLLPASEPRWRESGSVVCEEGRQCQSANRGQSANGRQSANGAARCWLQVGRGEYVASVALPRFPCRAVGEWMAARRGDVTLCQPIARLECAAHSRPPDRPTPPLAKNESVHVDSLM